MQLEGKKEGIVQRKHEEIIAKIFPNLMKSNQIAFDLIKRSKKFDEFQGQEK